MLVVKVELWPGGDEEQSIVVGSATIANVGGSDDLANYAAEFIQYDPGRA